MSKVSYAKIDEHGNLFDHKMIDPTKCPRLILSGEHYRDDGTCKCNDPNETVMAEWGYEWSDATGRWE